MASEHRSQTPQDPAPAGSFILGDEIGQGFLGVSYQALDQGTQQELVFKILSKLQTLSPSDFNTLERALRSECEQLGRASLPQASIPLAVSISDGQLVVVQEFFSGTPLNAILKNQSVIAPAIAMEILLPIARTLDTLHNTGFVHGHLTTHDIMVPQHPSQGPYPILRDLGLSSAVPFGRDRETVARLPLLAPETLRGEPSSASADRYAFAAICFQVLTGIVPIQGSTPRDIRERILSANRLLAATVNPKLSLAVSAIFEEALAMTPTDRPATLGDFMHRLSAALQLPSRPQDAEPSPLSFRASSGAHQSGFVGQPGQQSRSSSGAAEIQNRWRETLHERGIANSADPKAQTPGSMFNSSATPEQSSPRKQRKPQGPKRELPLWVFLAAGGGAMVLTIAVLLMSEFVSSPAEVGPPQALTAAEAFPEFQPPAAPPPPQRSELIAALNDQELIGLIADPSATVPQLNEALDMATERHIGDLALYVLPLLKHDNLAIRLSAARTLAKLRDRRAAPELMNFLDDKDPALRGAVAEALAQIGDRRALEYLKLRYTKERSPDMRLVMKRAIETLSAVPFEDGR